ncbi:uncharacterized protein LOC120478993 isoform X2 [Pimephales promelas]|uniref:uncharacterized protein LOC120478993 isoform X2 n=1 Tax=Pimephales promelas TaxID=90988 RepID=UPI0019557B2A|nr:uncharacterized protein LOC120478993 isoform X2 [Pimephales promelas]
MKSANCTLGYHRAGLTLAVPEVESEPLGRSSAGVVRCLQVPLCPLQVTGSCRPVWTGGAAAGLRDWKVCALWPQSHLSAWERKQGVAREIKQTIRA